MRPKAWLIRIYKHPTAGWRTGQTVWVKRSGKPTLTTRAVFQGQEIETPEGRFAVEWYENGKRQRLNVDGDEKAATKALARQRARLQAIDAGVIVPDESKNGKRLLKDAVDEFLAEKQRTKAHKTHVALKQVLDLFVQVAGVRYLEDVKRHTVMGKFLGALQEQQLADRTIYHRFACLISFLKAHDIRVVTLRDAPRYVETEIRCYTQRELESLFAACLPEERLLFQFFLGTGCREGEVQHAEWPDLADNGKVFHVREKKQWDWKPKGRKERRVRVPDYLAGQLLEAQKTSATSLIFPHSSGKPDGHLLRRLKAVVAPSRVAETCNLSVHRASNSLSHPSSESMCRSSR